MNEDGSEILFETSRAALPDTLPPRASRRPACAARRSGALLRRHGRRHVNYLSLDIEGAELSALRGVDWSSTTIDVMTVENAKQVSK